MTFISYFLFYSLPPFPLHILLSLSIPLSSLILLFIILSFSIFFFSESSFFFYSLSVPSCMFLLLNPLYISVFLLFCLPLFISLKTLPNLSLSFTLCFLLFHIFFILSFSCLIIYLPLKCSFLLLNLLTIFSLVLPCSRTPIT